MLKETIELLFGYPAKIASMLLNDEIDIGLIPVAVVPKLAEHHLVSQYCIGSEGPVASVCLFSEVPLNEIRTILVDYQSRTSVALLKILLTEHWKISPELIDTAKGFENSIRSTTAGLVIGDRALMLRQHSAFIFDLASAWKEMTGLPFVFAAWVANKQLPADFIELFDKASGEGLNHIDEIVAANPFEHYSLQEYYRSNISYILNDSRQKGLAVFLQKISQPSL
jgi:chorismate dehydratase